MCQRKSIKKYTTRKTPSSPANECRGKTKRGNDNKMYLSVPDKNGRYHWLHKRSRKSTKKKNKSLEKESKRTWYTHDNGGRPFKVVQPSPSIVEIYKHDNDQYNKLVKRYTNVKKIFVGTYGTDKYFQGNSLLLRLRANNRYVFIGERVYEFTSTENIREFYSPVGNNDAPSPLALSASDVYFFNYGSVDRVKQTYFHPETDFTQYGRKSSWRRLLQDTEQVYTQYRQKKSPKKKVRVKMIHERM